jgi:hypothetical protein
MKIHEDWIAVIIGFGAGLMSFLKILPAIPW